MVYQRGFKLAKLTLCFFSIPFSKRDLLPCCLSDSIIAGALDLQPRHFIGRGLDELSPAQLRCTVTLAVIYLDATSAYQSTILSSALEQAVATVGSKIAEAKHRLNYLQLRTELTQSSSLLQVTRIPLHSSLTFARHFCRPRCGESRP